MAKKDIKYWRNEAHTYFDMIWKEGHEDRDKLYEHLAERFKLEKHKTHIRMFDRERCIEVVDWAKMILNDLRRLDMDFGIKVSREHYER